MKLLPKLNTTQIQLLFFITGAFMGLTQPLAAASIAILMIILGRKNLIKSNK